VWGRKDGGRVEIAVYIDGCGGNDSAGMPGERRMRGDGTW
jgi:hypothetical protein